MQNYRALPVIILWAVALTLGLGLVTPVLAEEVPALSCQPDAHRLSEFNVKKAPKKVLLVPLLYSNPEYPGENERWPEPSARRLSELYQSQFGAHVHWLRNVRNWQDYYDQTDALIAQGARFDRVIFIAHGGFDGPVMRNEIISETRVVEGDQAKVLKIS